MYIKGGLGAKGQTKEEYKQVNSFPQIRRNFYRSSRSSICTEIA